MAEVSKVQEFYKDRNVFITGGTGFMGKILIEKLLRSTEVSTLYVLVREKKGKNVHTRIDELFDDVIFDALRKECPKFKHRVEAISGDCSVTGLGLSISDRQKLFSNIHIVFHVAATVRFDENLKLAYAINVNGTRDVLEMARQMKNLKALIHVSTAYSNCHLKEVHEKFYDYNISYEDVASVLEKLNKNEAEMVTPRIINPWPNTYVFTKALAESLLRNNSSGLPVGVFRPGIVVSTYKDPVEGWTDNLYGATGVCVGAMSGLLRVCFSDKDVVADIVPVDTCVAGLIASAWDVGTKECERTPENIPIYNYVSSPENPITWNEYVDLNVIHGLNYPTVNSVWITSVTLTKNPVIYWILKFLYHILPAIVFDGAAVLTGNKPRALRMYKRIHRLSNILAYFSVRQWRFHNDNTVGLWKKLNETDRALFPLSMMTVHWMLYFREYVKGLRFYLLKDPDSTLEIARRRNKRFTRLNQLLRIIFTFTICVAVYLMCVRVLNVVF
ncbi:hypothetical protein NQ318_015032 [Aromia moschata]|uniref:Fatty acyl-CoA reductase n=1 Tax=Aromia moschata TaxID=1265417 RepID=A0AAV8YZQ8_9CUCU|nr:hypothetical protein NQ318_015032 [Aromia moschata]